MQGLQALLLLFNNWSEEISISDLHHMLLKHVGNLIDKMLQKLLEPAEHCLYQVLFVDFFMKS